MTPAYYWRGLYSLDYVSMGLQAQAPCESISPAMISTRPVLALASLHESRLFLCDSVQCVPMAC